MTRDSNIDNALRKLDAPSLSPSFDARLRAALSEEGQQRQLRPQRPFRPTARRLLALVAVLALAAGGGFGVGLAVASNGRAATAGTSVDIPAPTFATNPGWSVRTTGSLPPITGSSNPPQSPTAIASTVPLDSHDTFPTFPNSTLANLPPDGIVIYAVSAPVSPDLSQLFPPTSLPFDLSNPSAVQRSWEGQPNAKVPQYLLLGSVYNDAYELDVRVFFGTQEPSHQLLEQAQAEVATLRVEPTP